MENASRAILMAGGILIAVILISILILAFNKISDFKQVEIDKESREQIVKFNNIFLSYKKNAMYGTDIISILNLAIDNNIKYKVNSDSEEYFVNIGFTLNQEIKDIIYVYTLNSMGTYNKATIATSTLRPTDTLMANIEYTILDNKQNLVNFLANANANDSEIFDEIHKDNNKSKIITSYKEIFYGMANFKRLTFKCSKVTYDDNGRVKKMKFIQIGSLEDMN